MYFSSLFPYLVLICFLVRALLLEGSMVGIRHMFTPKVSSSTVNATFRTSLFRPHSEENHTSSILVTLRIKRCQSCQRSLFEAKFRQNLIDKNSYGSQKSSVGV